MYIYFIILNYIPIGPNKFSLSIMSYSNLHSIKKLIIINIPNKINLFKDFN